MRLSKYGGCEVTDTTGVRSILLYSRLGGEVMVFQEGGSEAAAIKEDASRVYAVGPNPASIQRTAGGEDVVVSRFVVILGIYSSLVIVERLDELSRVFDGRMETTSPAPRRRESCECLSGSIPTDRGQRRRR